MTSTKELNFADVPSHPMYSTNDCLETLESSVIESLGNYLDQCDEPPSSITLYGCELFSQDDCCLPMKADNWSEALDEALCEMGFEWYGSRIKPESRADAIEWMTSNIYKIAEEYDVKVDKELCKNAFSDGVEWWTRFQIKMLAKEMRKTYSILKIELGDMLDRINEFEAKLI